jgi:hypothetical protein
LIPTLPEQKILIIMLLQRGDGRIKVANKNPDVFLPQRPYRQIVLKQTQSLNFILCSSTT